MVALVPDRVRTSASLSVTQHKLKHIFFASILSQWGLTYRGQVAQRAY